MKRNIVCYHCEVRTKNRSTRVAIPRVYLPCWLRPKIHERCAGCNPPICSGCCPPSQLLPSGKHFRFQNNYVCKQFLFIGRETIEPFVALFVCRHAYLLLIYLVTYFSTRAYHRTVSFVFILLVNFILHFDVSL